mmetsp:Transcript_12226/g.20739  ORF Transcript_12226/g.20739 Transcript_12226/m.20739 type:complete len:104 (-) Transcript_12226:879-1190(-)
MTPARQGKECAHTKLTKLEHNNDIVYCDCADNDVFCFNDNMMSAKSVYPPIKCNDGSLFTQHICKLCISTNQQICNFVVTKYILSSPLNLIIIKSTYQNKLHP